MAKATPLGDALREAFDALEHLMDVSAGIADVPPDATVLLRKLADMIVAEEGDDHRGFEMHSIARLHGFVSPEAEYMATHTVADGGGMI